MPVQSWYAKLGDLKKCAEKKLMKMCRKKNKTVN